MLPHSFLYGYLRYPTQPDPDLQSLSGPPTDTQPTLSCYGIPNATAAVGLLLVAAKLGSLDSVSRTIVSLLVCEARAISHARMGASAELLSQLLPGMKPSGHPPTPPSPYEALHYL